MTIQTRTLCLDLGVLERLQDYARRFRRCFQRIDQYPQSRTYLHGPLLDGERTSIESMSRRVLDGEEQRLQQLINQSPWDTAGLLRAYRASMKTAFAAPDVRILTDDTGFPKQGKHSVGVAHQYLGTLDKRGNCHVAVSLHHATSEDESPRALRVYLPEAWTSAPERLDAAYVPKDERAFQTKW